MTIEEMSKNVQKLLDMEEIRNVRFNYWWYLDHKQWDKFSELFTEDLVYTNLSNGNKQTDKAAWVASLDKFLNKDVRSSHHGHQHKIEIIDETHASGVWVLRDDLYNVRANTEFLGRGWYFDKYRKENGVWKICEFALIYNMAKGGGMNAYGPDTAPELMSVTWDIGKYSCDELNEMALSAIEKAGWKI